MKGGLQVVDIKLGNRPTGETKMGGQKKHLRALFKIVKDALQDV